MSTPLDERIEHGCAGSVAVWRSSMLAGTETFIRNQIDMHDRWRTVGIGAERSNSPLARPSDIVLYGSSPSEKILRRLFYTFQYSARLVSAIRAHDVKVVHAHFLPEGLRVMSSAQRADVPLVVTAHGYDVQSKVLVGDQRYARSLSRLFKQASCIIAVSKYIFDCLVDLGCAPEKIRVLPVGIPLTTYAAKSGVGHRYDFAFVGRLIEAKGTRDALLAISKIPGAEGLRIAVVGAGPLRDTLAALARELGLAVDFLGHLDPDSVRDVLSTSKIFIGPSKTGDDGCREAFGLVFLEAAAAGIPSVAYASGGVPEAVVHGETGFLAPEGDVQKLAEHCERLLAEDALRTTMGSNGRQRVIEQFDARKQKVQLERVYSEYAR